MADRNPNQRANLGEQSNDNTGSDIDRTSIEGEDRSMSGAPQTDSAAGSEGIEDPAIDRSRREELDMEAGERETAERDAETGRSMRESSSQHTERGQSNNRQQGRESTDNNSGSFSGQGGQMGGTPDREGTGYTSDDSSAEESDGSE